MSPELVQEATAQLRLGELGKALNSIVRAAVKLSSAAVPSYSLRDTMEKRRTDLALALKIISKELDQAARELVEKA